MNGYVSIAQISAFIIFSLEVSAVLSNHFTDKWAVQVTGGERVARELAAKYGFIYLDQIMPDYYHFQHRKVAKRSAYSSSYHHRDLVKDKNVKWLEQQIVKKRVKRDIQFNDPKWPKMWYLNRGRGLDMNVQMAWALGYTGKGVVVTILDDGIEKDHPDLSENYDLEASYDVNSNDNDPQPRYDSSNENRHGTRCAGEVAAQADNHFCSVGVAFDARIGGVRMLDGDVTDSVEAKSLSLNPQHIHVYSASWGPDDDGRTVDGPATLARRAFYEGITKGRGGLGSIFVWASGNGGSDHDSCNCDGYTNSIYTLSISSATENGHIPWYSEACSSTLATTYSSGSGGEKQIVTTDLRKSCTETHTGTSASAPLAAGLCAMALQANPLLTWRDMQHLVVVTAKPSNLQDDDWITNGVGRKVSHSFGYGLMDAVAMVQVAKNWTTVPPQHICEIRSQGHKKIIPMHGKITVPLYTNGCEGQSNMVRYLEHVEAKVTLTASRRGEISIYLTSPVGTRSTLLDRRVRDTSREGFNTWAFMTTHSWGELAKGTWILQIENGASISELKDWKLVVMGTATNPQNHHYNPPIMMPGSAPNTHQLPECAGVSSNGVCIECVPGYFLLDDKCVIVCPSGHYGKVVIAAADQTTPDANTSNWEDGDMRPYGQCMACHSSCATCQGPGNNCCFSCSHGFYFSNEICVSKASINLEISIVLIVLGVACILLITTGTVVLKCQSRMTCCTERHNVDSKGKYNGISLSSVACNSEDEESDCSDPEQISTNAILS